ncbi:unnamed protein product [Pseudo-nitzschia multistriata]|uniref:Uncharacterized protein n=1 Tax=Pseudo-nitzschia multistriata TaxID=183589 RepID=A0A448YYL9_9STRA|nr:unnamed protein product [Pseudo-nitzschia multistriata]
MHPKGIAPGNYNITNFQTTKPLTSFRNGIPSIKRLHAGKGFERNILAEHTREMESGGLDKVSRGSKHSNTTVLQFGGTEPSEGFLTSEIGESQRIEALEWGCESGHLVQLGSTERSGSGILCGRGKRRSAGGKCEEEGGDLHGEILQFEFICLSRAKGEYLLS